MRSCGLGDLSALNGAFASLGRIGFMSRLRDGGIALKHRQSLATAVGQQQKRSTSAVDATPRPADEQPHLPVPAPGSLFSDSERLDQPD